MPTYDYVCDACQHKFELFQSITEAHKKKCPECGKNKLRRLIGAGAAIMFKGSGFYITDYKGGSNPASSGKSESSSSTPASSESKPAATTKSE